MDPTCCQTPPARSGELCRIQSCFWTNHIKRFNSVKRFKDFKRQQHVSRAFQETAKDSMCFKSTFQEHQFDVGFREFQPCAPALISNKFYVEVLRASRVSSISRDSNTFQECFKRQQEMASVSRVSRACFKSDQSRTIELSVKAVCRALQ